jgi:hypothetical protein
MRARMSFLTRRDAWELKEAAVLQPGKKNRAAAACPVSICSLTRSESLGDTHFEYSTHCEAPLRETRVFLYPILRWVLVEHIVHI